MQKAVQRFAVGRLQSGFEFTYLQGLPETLTLNGLQPLHVRCDVRCQPKIHPCNMKAGMCLCGMGFAKLRIRGESDLEGVDFFPGILGGFGDLLSRLLSLPCS